MTGSAAGSSSLVKVCHQDACDTRIKSCRSLGTLRIPTTVFISMGKKTIRAQMRILLVASSPNQITSSGA